MFRIEKYYFRKDKKGQNIFYPWGCPGEAYFIAKGQKERLKQSLFATILLMVVLPLFLSIIMDMLHIFPQYSMWIFLIPANVAFFVYVFLVVVSIKKLQMYKEEVNGRVRKRPRIYKDLAFLLAMHFFVVFALLYTGETNALVYSYCVFVVIFYSTLMAIVLLKKGYISQNSSQSLDNST